MSSRSALSIAILVAALAGCQKAPAPPPATTAAPAPAGPIRIIAADYAYSGAPDTVQPGWHDLRMVNQGKQPHMAALMRIDSGKTVNDLVAAIKNRKPVGWTTEVGGVNALLPGDSLMTSLDLTPGRYVVGCFVTDSTGKPHLFDGMLASFVVADAGPAAMSEPVADDSVQLTSYRITFLTPPTAGMHVIRVQNVDTTATNHDFVIARIDDGKTAADVKAWLLKALTKTADSPPPFTVAGATTGLPPGAHDYVHANFTPGNYLVMCLMPDKQNRPHFTDGMAETLTVK